MVCIEIYIDNLQKLKFFIPNLIYIKYKLTDLKLRNKG